MVERESIAEHPVTEGVIQFQCEHRFESLPSFIDPLWHTLRTWRARLAELGVVGADPQRYDGYGFGNLSARVEDLADKSPRAFLVTGTQTSGRGDLTRDDVCLVTEYDYTRNWVRSVGMVKPSSESMTHAALYDCRADLRFVFHGHSPFLWRNAAAFGIPTTALDVGYGTVAMAREVQRLCRDDAANRGCILAMGGHEDGILTFGVSAEHTGQLWYEHLQPQHPPRPKPLERTSS
jgi:L-ribulose-5-phosphate 4-epimerase